MRKLQLIIAYSTYGIRDGLEYKEIPNEIIYPLWS